MKTKILLWVCLVGMTFTSVNAQVKIGDNAGTINPNSLFELESSSKGFLAPRIALNDVNSVSPLSGAVPEGMLVYNLGGTLPNGFYIWGGSKWIAVQTMDKLRLNRIIIKSEADFPAPVSGVITLVPGTLYEINGTVTVTNKINLNGCYLIGVDANNDKLVFTPASGELITGTKGGTIKTLTLSAPSSKLFNVDLGASENLIVRDNIIANCNQVGLIKGGYIIFFSVINYAGNLNGITYQNIANLLIDNVAWFANNSNTFEKFIGSFDVIEKLGGFSLPNAALGAIALDVSGITSISQTGNMKNGAVVGTGVHLTGSFSSKWEVEYSGLTTEKDDVATGNLYLTVPQVTAFSATNTPAKILGTTVAASLFRVSSPMNNRLVYTGGMSRRFQVICSLSLTGSSANKNYTFYIVKNGVVLNESRQAMRLSSGVDKGSLTLSCTVAMNTNDYIEVYAENNSDNSGITVEYLNLAIK